ALPLTNGFVGEFMLLLGLYEYQPWAAAFAGLTIILGAVYMLSAYQKICLGTPVASNSGAFEDLTREELAVMVPLAACIFFFGIYPKPLLDLSGPAVDDMLRILQSAASR